MTQVLAPVGVGSNNGEVVTLADGGFMVVWTHLVSSLIPIAGVSDDQFSAVLGRTFNADGTPRGEVFQVNQSDEASGQSQADVSVLSNGNVVVVWEDGPSFETGNIGAVESYARVFTAAGVPVTDEIQLSSNTEDDQRSPKVVADDRGGFIAVWADGADPFSNTDPAVMAQRFEGDGSRVGPEVYVDQLGDEDMELLHVGNGVITVVSATANATIDIDDTYVRSDGLTGSTRSGVGGSSSYNFGFGFDDDAVQSGDGGYVALNASVFAPALSFWTTREIDNNQVSDFPDGTPPSDTIPDTRQSRDVIDLRIELTFDGEDQPEGVDFFPQTSHWSAAAATELANGDIVVAWTAVSGGTRDDPEFSVYAATVSAEGVVLSDTVLIAADVQGSSIAPPFITAGTNDSVFIGWTDTTDRNGEGTNEIFGGTFDVPRQVPDGQAVGSNDADVITGVAGAEQRIYLRDGDDTFIQGELSGFDSLIYGMGGDDLFVMTDADVAQSIIAGAGHNTLDLSTAASGQNVFPLILSSHDERTNLDGGFGTVIGSFFDDTIRAPGVPFLTVGLDSNVTEGYVHAESGDDTITLNGPDAGGMIDGGDGFDVITSLFNRDDWVLTFEGDHYTLGYLFEAYQSEEPPAVRDGYLLEVRGVEEIQFADQTVTLQTTASQDSGAYANQTPAPNADPVAVTDTYDVDLLDILVIPFADLLANDTDADGDPLSVVSVNVTSSNGRAQVVLDYMSLAGIVTAGYSLVYTPSVDALGLETLTYEITDSNGGTAQGAIEVTATQSVPPNEAPITTPDSAQTPFGTALSIELSELTTNDSDPDGDTLTISNVISTTHGQAVISATGGLDFTPEDTFSGTAVITYEVSDGNGGTAQSTLSIVIDAPDNTAGTVEVSFGDENDAYTGSALSDEISGGLGDDTFSGGAGDDSLDGGAGFDELNGGEGNDVITDAMGAVIDGGNGSDIATVQAGNNIFNDTGVVADQTSFAIDDTYRGGFANDSISGGEGNDILVGDSESMFFYGEDTLDGGIGVDILTGGFGADVFFFSVGDSTSDGLAASAIMGADVIGAVSNAAVDTELAQAPNDIRTLQNQASGDFEVGIDIVQLEGFDAALQASILGDLDSFVTDTAEGTEFEAAGVRILFADITETELLAVDVADVFQFV